MDPPPPPPFPPSLRSGTPPPPPPRVVVQNRTEPPLSPSPSSLAPPPLPPPPPQVIVSRMRYIGWHVNRTIRLIGLSTALSNARDLADWMGIEARGLYNFRPSVRPVPVEVHIAGFPGKHYCPRMATMNKPAYNAIMQHSPAKPVLIFVSSRRQTRLTALDIINYLAADAREKHFVRLSDDDMEMILDQVSDQHLRYAFCAGGARYVLRVHCHEEGARLLRGG